MAACGKWIVLALVLVGWGQGAPLAAQELPRPVRTDAFRDMPSQLLKDLGRKLELSDEQKARIVVLKREFEEKNKAKLNKLRQDVQRVRQTIQAARKTGDAAVLKKAKGEAKSLRQVGELLQHEFEANLLTVLTDSQRQQFASLKAASAEPRRPPAAPATSTVGTRPADRR